MNTKPWFYWINQKRSNKYVMNGVKVPKPKMLPTIEKMVIHVDRKTIRFWGRSELVFCQERFA